MMRAESVGTGFALLIFELKYEMIRECCDFRVGKRMEKKQ